MTHFVYQLSTDNVSTVRLVTICIKTANALSTTLNAKKTITKVSARLASLVISLSTRPAKSSFLIASNMDPNQLASPANQVTNCYSLAHATEKISLAHNTTQKGCVPSAYLLITW